MSELRFKVPGITCRHCADAVSAHISRVVGVEDMRVDPETRWVVVWGQELDVEAIRTAVDETGHSAAL
jgi:copper chaperone CopZ